MAKLDDFSELITELWDADGKGVLRGFIDDNESKRDNIRIAVCKTANLTPSAEESHPW